MAHFNEGHSSSFESQLTERDRDRERVREGGKQGGREGGRKREKQQVNVIQFETSTRNVCMRCYKDDQMGTDMLHFLTFWFCGLDTKASSFEVDLDMEVSHH